MYSIVGDMMNDINKIMNGIQYGFINDGVNLYENKWEDSFPKYYRLQSPAELLLTKYGVCYDQVELERYLFNKNNIDVETYFIISYDNKQYPTHTFLTYEQNNKFYWYEHSWELYRGLHEYSSMNDLLKDVFFKFSNSYKNDGDIVLYKYEKPNYGLKAIDFINYCENGLKISI